MPLSSKSSLKLSIHLFLGLSLLLSILIWSCSAAFGCLFPSTLFSCPNHVGLLLLIFSFTLGFFSTTLFLPPVVFFHLPSSLSSAPIHKVRLGAPVSNTA